MSGSFKLKFYYPKLGFNKSRAYNVTFETYANNQGILVGSIVKITKSNGWMNSSELNNVVLKLECTQYDGSKVVHRLTWNQQLKEKLISQGIPCNDHLNKHWDEMKNFMDSSSLSFQRYPIQYETDEIFQKDTPTPEKGDLENEKQMKEKETKDNELHEIAEENSAQENLNPNELKNGKKIGILQLTRKNEEEEDNQQNEDYLSDDSSQNGMSSSSSLSDDDDDEQEERQEMKQCIKFNHFELRLNGNTPQESNLLYISYSKRFTQFLRSDVPLTKDKSGGYISLWKTTDNITISSKLNETLFSEETPVSHQIEILDHKFKVIGYTNLQYSHDERKNNLLPQLEPQKQNIYSSPSKGSPQIGSLAYKISIVKQTFNSDVHLLLSNIRFQIPQLNKSQTPNQEQEQQKIHIAYMFTLKYAQQVAFLYAPSQESEVCSEDIIFVHNMNQNKAELTLHLIQHDKTTLIASSAFIIHKNISNLNILLNSSVEEYDKQYSITLDVSHIPSSQVHISPEVHTKKQTQRLNNQISATKNQQIVNILQQAKEKKVGEPIRTFQKRNSDVQTQQNKNEVLTPQKQPIMRNNQLSTNNLAKSLFILPSKGFEEGSLPQKNVTRLKPLNMEPQQKIQKKPFDLKRDPAAIAGLGLNSLQNPQPLGGNSQFASLKNLRKLATDSSSTKVILQPLEVITPAAQSILQKGVLQNQLQNNFLQGLVRKEKNTQDTSLNTPQVEQRQVHPMSELIRKKKFQVRKKDVVLEQEKYESDRLYELTKEELQEFTKVNCRDSNISVPSTSRPQSRYSEAAPKEERASSLAEIPSSVQQRRQSEIVKPNKSIVLQSSPPKNTNTKFMLSSVHHMLDLY